MMRIRSSLTVALLSGALGCAGNLDRDELREVELTEEEISSQTAALVTKNGLESTVTTSGDTFVRAFFPFTTAGSATVLGLDGALGVRSLVQFSQAELQEAVGAHTIASARLELTIKNAATVVGTPSLALHRMTRSWTEGGATWSNTFWDNGGFAPATDFFPITPGQAGVVSFDVATDVNGFLTGTFTNLGWMIGQDPLSGSSCSLDFNSREFVNGLTVGPKLVITLNPICNCAGKACGADDGCGNECPGTCPGTESCSNIGDDQFMCFEALDWASHRDLTDQRFSELFDQYRDRGWMITDVDAYPEGASVRYSMIWQENKDGRGWAEWRDLTSDGYHAKWEELRDQGYRPTDVEGYLVNGQQRFAGIWIENVEGLQWYSQRGLTAAEYGTVFDERMGMGWRLIDMEAYPTPNGLRYACIWIDNNQTNLAWAQYRDMSRETYQQRIDEFSSGYRVIDYESYQIDGQQRYAAIWEEDNSGRAEQVRTNRTEIEFANLWRDYADQGYRLIDFERYDTASGPRYGGVWRENNFRFRWTRKSDVATAVDNYYATFGSNGAVSVAVMQNGRMLYRRGVGVANQATGANAYGDSIYALASISKTIGGTLAVKLQDEQVLADGAPLVETLDLSDQTTTYLPGLDTADTANVHTHTVDQLLAHLACIPHYDGWGNLDGNHYNTALAASEALWNQSTTLVPGCTIGANWNYSTHAFTFVGAVLENVTGRSISRLIQEELADQFGLDTMRVLYAQAIVPAKADRVIGLESNGMGVTEDTPVNISWKVLGGGIESSAVDLARFGNRVLDGTIVTPAIRDNVLWSQVDPNSNNGRAWELNTRGGRRVAEHGGAGTNGNRTETHLRVYRDDGLVITVLRNNRINGNVTDLVDDIADEVFAP